VRSDGPRWKPDGFENAIDAWVYSDLPSDDVQQAVWDWVLDQMSNPYRGMEHDDAEANLWFGPIPGTRSGLVVVTCSYWILEQQRVVRADIIGAQDFLD
jgi:hypothetical protein